MLIRWLMALITLTMVGTAMATEEPKYEVVGKFGDIELRLYEPMIVAETWVDGSMDDASGRGFRLIADYIFGNNTAVAGGSREIPMTAPVTMEPESKKISMTAPVTMEEQEGRWRVHFVMPSLYTMETLPAPNNDAVKLREIPEKYYAVIQFSGFAGEEKVAKKTAELMAFLAERELEPLSAPELARYDPPWTLPFFRRNEVMVAYAAQ
ncbi:SOUL family heme-binding protein [Pseudidiomarina aestuarii]|nr:heme-binding protein [Pseudidiomarina aestuarii]